MADDPRLAAVLETVIYCDRDERDSLERFYSDLLGLEEVMRFDDGTAFRIGPGVLLIFDRGKLAARDGAISAHGSSGPGHVCLRAAGEDYEAWAERVRDGGIEITHEQEWREGLRSFYFSDPAGNLLEIAEADIWPAGSAG